MKRKKNRYEQPIGPRPASDWEKMKARKLADRYEVPVTETLRVIRGEVGLDEVLREQEARKKALELIEDGLDSQLAGQVARGGLDPEDAKIRSQLLGIQKRSFRYTSLNKYEPGQDIAVYLFEYGLLTGRVQDNAPYDIDLMIEGARAPVMVKKHDIKMHFPIDQAENIVELIQRDESIAEMGFGATVDMAERYRPVPEEALAWLTMPLPVKFVIRDGDLVIGRVKRVSIYEVEVELKPNLCTTLMTHALLKQKVPSFLMDV